MSVTLSEWVNHNWFTLLGILLILTMVGYHDITYRRGFADVVEMCNEHYHNELRNICPAALEDKFSLLYNTSELDLGFDDIEISPIDD